MLQADVRLETSLPEDWLDVNQLVAVAQQLLCQIGGAILSQLLVQVQERMLEATLGCRWSKQPQQEAPWACPHCGSHHSFQRRGNRERERLRTGVGDVAFDFWHCVSPSLSTQNTGPVCGACLTKSLG